MSVRAEVTSEFDNFQNLDVILLRLKNYMTSDF